MFYGNELKEAYKEKLTRSWTSEFIG